MQKEKEKRCNQSVTSLCQLRKSVLMHHSWNDLQPRCLVTHNSRSRSSLDRSGLRKQYEWNPSLLQTSLNISALTVEMSSWNIKPLFHWLSALVNDRIACEWTPVCVCVFPNRLLLSNCTHAYYDLWERQSDTKPQSSQCKKLAACLSA